MSSYTNELMLCDWLLAKMYADRGTDTININSYQEKGIRTLHDIRVAKDKLLKDGHIHVSVHNDGTCWVSAEGAVFIANGGYKSRLHTEETRNTLTSKKLEYDVKNAERIYKTYWWTFVLAIAGFAISLTLLILKLKE